MHYETLAECDPLRHCGAVLAAQMAAGFHGDCATVTGSKPSADCRNVRARFNGLLLNLPQKKARNAKKNNASSYLWAFCTAMCQHHHSCDDSQ